MRSCLLIALVVVTAACTSGSGDDADSLSDLLEPPTTLAPPNTSATTPIQIPSTTSTTATVPSTTTTIAETTEVLSAAESDAQAIQELPLTGVEPQAAFIALLMLTLGAWLVRRANVAQSIVDRIRANLTRP